MPSTIDSIQIITDNTPSVTDWLMVGITFVYVVATILILIANYKSARAAEKQIQQAKEQLEESERQFLESQRISCMPFLQLEYDETPHNGTFFIGLYPDCYHAETNTYEFSEGEDNYFWLKNIGNGAAANLSCTWKYSNGKSEMKVFPINGLMHRDKYPIILFVEANNKIEVTLEWVFTDLLGNEYTQKVDLCFENGGFKTIENDIPIH